MKHAMFRYDPVRVVVVTLGLGLAGAAFGGLSAAIALATVMALTGVGKSLGLVALAGEIGAILGVISAPLVVWVLLRRVPLGRAFLWQTLSATLGGIFGWFAFSSMDVIFGPTITAFVAFMSSAVFLSFCYDRAPALTTAGFARFKAR